MNQDESQSALLIDNFSSCSEGVDRVGINEDSFESLGQYQREAGFYNNLEESISLVEKASKKILPIYKELLRKLVRVKENENNEMENLYQ